MCGRFTNQYTWRELVDLYRITEPYIHPISNLEPRFNFAPMQRGVVVRLDKEGRREPVMMRWGLVPSWSKDDKVGAPERIRTGGFCIGRAVVYVRQKKPSASWR